jgi:glycosyltransferase involved in cell wall biosynthesis
MHDMWPALGSRHYQTGDPLGPLGAAIDRWVYRRKLRTYRRIGDMTLCPPSKWLAGVARKSLLTGDWPCEVIPNGADLGTFVPDPRRASREMLGFPDNARVIAFGASGGVDDPRKGGILLAAALRAGADRLRASNVQLLVFGGDAGMFSGLGVPIVAREHIRSRSDMAQIYQAADLVVVPSRMENLSLTVLEAMACAAPVLAFRIGGMPDMIDDGYTGWLAPELGSPSLLEALERALAQIAQDPQFGARARAEVVRRFSLPGEAAAMERLFEGILENKRRRGG